MDTIDHLIITRFNYRFKSTDPIEPLINEQHWNERMNLFKVFCFPSIIAQTNTNFDWILIIDQLLPKENREQLETLIQKHYQSQTYESHGPRKIILHEWDYQDHLNSLTWIQSIRPLIKPLLITTRLDNDDALSRTFVDQIQKLAKTKQIHGFLMVSYSSGYSWNRTSNHRVIASPVPRTKLSGWFKPSKLSMIALGLSLITKREAYPFTIYFGRHTRQLEYLKNPDKHPLLKKLYQQNGHLLEQRAARLALARKRYLIVKQPSVYIRTVHGFNDQRGLTPAKTRNPNNKLTPLLKKLFALDWAIIE